MLNSDEVEIRNHNHLMDAEGKHDVKPSKDDIIQCLKVDGYDAYNINIWFDNLMNLWLWRCDIKEIK